METQTPRLDPTTEAALGSLKDIAVPDPVSWVPQTWGWALLGCFAALVILGFALRLLRRYRANAYRREAMSLLDIIEARMGDPARRHEGVHDLAELLKRVALAGWPRRNVAAISGEAWVGFLAEHGCGQSDPTLARVLDDFEYRDDATLDSMPSNVGADLATSARRWIEVHRVSA